jgi:acetyl esterase/lipase
MTDTRPADHISKKPVVLTAPGTDDVDVHRDVPYQRAGAPSLAMDVYYPPATPQRTKMPAVVFVSGGTDAGMQRALGCTFREMASTTSWARLLAARGITGIAYSNERAEDVHHVLAHVRANAGDLRIDAGRIGVWASSGNVPMALSVLIGDPRIACAALLYGYMLDWPGSTLVADTLTTWGFANPAAAQPIADLPATLPIFIARAGREQFPHLNEALDRFVADAIARNMPLTFVNHASGAHAFDILEPNAPSRAVVAQALAFLEATLSPAD